MEDCAIKRQTPAYPLSSLQKSVWADQLLHGDIPLYNTAAYIIIDETLDPLLFAQALAHVIGKNDALRLILRQGEEQPLQTIASPLGPGEAPRNLTYIDFSQHEPGDAAARALRWMEEEVAVPFQIYGDYLCRFSLIKIAERRYYWLSTYHHLIIDGWVVTLVVERVAEAYRQLLAGEPLPAAPAPSYLDFVEDDRAYFESAQFRADAEYWSAVYRTLPEPLLQPRPGARDGTTRRSLQVQQLLPPALCDALRAFAAAHKTSVLQLFLGVLYCYFVRTGGREDFAIGLFSMNRRTPAFQQTVGMFSNTIAAWYRLGTEHSFLELLRRMKEATAAGAAHRRFPLSELSRRIGLLGAERVHPFDVTLSYMSRTCDAKFGDSPVTFRSLFPGYLQEGLSIHVEDLDAQGSIRMLLEGSGAVFAAGELERIQERLAFLLSIVISNPHAQIGELPMMQESERNQILVQWNQTDAPFPLDACIHHLFEDQVLRSPDQIALVHGPRSLSYLQLNHAANRLARELVERGAGPDVLIPLLIDRSLESFIAIVAVLKAGAAYVPLDPLAPLERLRFIIKDCQPTILLTHKPLHDLALSIVDPAQTSVLVVQESLSEVAVSSNPVHRAGPSNLAYLIYTSGSTGRPKGVLIEHRSVTNHCASWTRRLGLSAGKRFIQMAPLFFDAAVWEIFPALTSGGTLYIPPEEARLPGPELLEFLTRHRIQVMGLTPSALAALTQAPLPELEHLLVGGEACPLELVQRWADGRTMWNGYGPTEATCDASTAICQLDAGRPTIGRPLDNIKIYILDPKLHPQPIGVAGEIHIAGVCLARGYLNHADLTQSKFIASPFVPGERLYKTGDQGRYLENGEIEYLGRVDQQIKLRGYRIELEEIEAVVMEHPEVCGCAVVCREEAGGNKRLVAYVVVTGGEVSEEQVRRSVAERVPQYMVPSVVVKVKELPLTGNGKVDRGRLPAPPEERSGERYEGPGTATEKTLAELFAEVLHLERVGIHDNFFALGGHSLLSVQLASRAERAGIPISVRDLYTHPTVSELAGRVKPGATVERQAARSLLVPLVEGRQPGAIVIIPAVGGHLSLPILHIARALGGQRPVLGLTTPPHAGTGPMPQTLQALCEQYLDAILAHVSAGPISILGYCFGGYSAIELAGQLDTAQRPVDRVVLLETLAPGLMDPDAEPYDRPQALLRIAAIWGITVDFESLAGLPEAEVIGRLMIALSASERTAQDTEQTLRAILDTQEAHLQLLERWTLRPPRAPVSLLRAADREDAPQDYGWGRELALSASYKIPGDHFGIVRPPHIETTTRLLRNLLIGEAADVEATT